MPRFTSVLLSLLCLGATCVGAPRVRSLQTQVHDGTTFFRVEIDAPADLRLPEQPDNEKDPGESVRRLGQMPRLLPVGPATLFFQVPRKAGRVPRLVFFGRLDEDKKPARCLLSYPVKAAGKKGLAALAADAEMRTVEVHLDWKKAVPLEKPLRRGGRQAADTDDLQGLWGEARGWQVGALEGRAPEMGFFTLAREVLGKQMRVSSPRLVTGMKKPEGRWAAGLYELTTGAEAITESLALNRTLRQADADALRTERISDITGVTVPSHPWKQMMAGKKPAAEPLAHLVPEDNYYLTVEKPQTLVEAMDLLQRWGGNVMRSFVLHDRDHAIRPRYEKQLCLPSAELQKAIPAKLLNGIALTGHDLYWQDGTDVTVLFDTTDPHALLEALEPFVERARKEHGNLRRSRSTYRRVRVKSFTTPHREVSLHRAVLGKVVVCSNSLDALQRVIDVYKGFGVALADALDFQYMRTVFARDAKSEDGFAFVSDAFVRHLVSPATRIKAARRLQARAVLTLVSWSALLGGWQTGRLPKSHEAMREAGGVEAKALRLPEGKPAVWDSERGQAVSEVYNTLAFTTPLVELPITHVTTSERADYEEFRKGYQRLWQRFFDPFGIRFKLDQDRVRVETYILPLVNSNRYNDLRQLAAGLFADDPARFRAGMLGQFVLGSEDEWFSIHMDADEKGSRQFLEWAIKRDLTPNASVASYEKLFWQLPLVLTIRVKEPERVSRFLVGLWKEELGGKNKLTEKKYRGVTIRQAPIDPQRYRMVWRFLKGFADSMGDDAPAVLSLLLMLPAQEAPPAFHAAIVGKQYYLSWNEAALKRQIDASLARKKADPAGAEVNAALRVSTRNKSTNALRTWLEWQTHRKALGSVAVWEALRRAGLDPAKPEAVRRLLGYVPISPDGTAFEIDHRLDEVRNTRHGSLSRPVCPNVPATHSPVAALLEQLNQIGVQLRFKEDGVYTILTLERVKK